MRDLSTETFLTRYSLRGVLCDPMTAMMGATMAMTAAGGALGAAGTIAGGNAAATAGQFQQSADEAAAQQLEQNAGLTRATQQRQALDERLKSNMLLSSLRAKGGASGTDLTSGSTVAVAGEIGRRGEYQALTTMAAGENQAIGLENQATAERYSGTAALYGGQLTRDASRIQAGATIANSGASMMKTYAAFKYPNLSGSPGLG